jgi:hypothetical protein
MMANSFLFDLVNLEGFPGGFFIHKLPTPLSMKASNHNRTASTETFSMMAICSFDTPSDKETSLMIAHMEPFDDRGYGATPLFLSNQFNQSALKTSLQIASTIAFFHITHT